MGWSYRSSVWTHTTIIHDFLLVQVHAMYLYRHMYFPNQLKSSPGTGRPCDRGRSYREMGQVRLHRPDRPHWMAFQCRFAGQVSYSKHHLPRLCRMPTPVKRRNCVRIGSVQPDGSPGLISRTLLTPRPVLGGFPVRCVQESAVWNQFSCMLPMRTNPELCR